MDLAVTVGAASVEEGTRSCRIVSYVTRVTLVAQPRHAHFEHTVIDGAVRFVATGTIVGNRRMFMKVGPSPLRMASVTVLIDAVLFELRRIGAPMRVVAVGTSDLSFPQRHVGGAQELGLTL